MEEMIAGRKQPAGCSSLLQQIKQRRRRPPAHAERQRKARHDHKQRFCPFSPMP